MRIRSLQTRSLAVTTELVIFQVSNRNCFKKTNGSKNHYLTIHVVALTIYLRVILLGP